MTPFLTATAVTTGRKWLLVSVAAAAAAAAVKARSRAPSGRWESPQTTMKSVLVLRDEMFVRRSTSRASSSTLSGRSIHSTPFLYPHKVRTSLGLVRRRVRGIVRGCEDRDLAAEGSVTEEAFLAVLKDQGILQQLGWVVLRCLVLGAPPPPKCMLVDYTAAGATSKGVMPGTLEPQDSMLAKIDVDLLMCVDTFA